VNGPLHWWSAHDLVRAIRTREVSAAEVMRAHLDRIEAVNPRLNAIVTLLGEREAMAMADAADRAVASGGPLGPLHGLPFAVKDLMDTAGMRTTYGSPIYADHVPATDSLLAQRIREAGALIIGKTNTPEWGAGSQTFNPVFGATRNPYDLARTCGGSSGGAAVVLAAGMLPLADGSDLGGSLRNPAAFCNVVGLRPAPGRVPSGTTDDAFDPHPILGPMARTPRDAGLLLSVLAGYDARSPIALADDPAAFADVAARDLEGVRIAWSATAGLPVDPEILAVLAAAREVLVARGAVIADVEPDLDGADEVFETFRALGMVPMAADIEAHPGLVKETIRLNVEQGLALRPQDIARAAGLRTALYRRSAALMAEHDVLALPVTQVLPFAVEQEYPTEIAGVPLNGYIAWMRSCSRISATTLPAMSVPAGFTPGGLPVGLQLVGAPRGELGLLAIGASVQDALGAGDRRPGRERRSRSGPRVLTWGRIATPSEHE
jgi:amidase